MIFNQIDINDQKNECKSRIESLENWLRRIVDKELTEKYGSDYLNKVKKEIKDNIQIRHDKSPDKYSRLIDASDLSHLIQIFCNPSFYNDIFIKYQNKFYPENMSKGENYLRYLFDKLYEIRCNLSHANEISIKDFEFVMYFTSAQIESYNDFYIKSGKEQDYNVPKILEVIDSFGHSMKRKDFDKFEMFDFTLDPKSFLRPGDTLSLEVLIDPSYQDSKSQYRFGGTNQDYSYKNKLIYTIQNHDVCERKVIYCQVRSDKAWHRKFNLDDQISLYYKVLPPIED